MGGDCQNCNENGRDMKQNIINTIKEIKQMCNELEAMAENLEQHIKELEHSLKQENGNENK